jgi:3-hydroxyisobutyrate dehydrogenase-like beta-hydroxyacid dehydrogenase
MGSPMAINLRRAGFDVVGYNRTKRRHMTDRTFAPGERIALHHKDMGIVTGWSG